MNVEAPRAQPMYFVSPAVDFLLVGGLSILLFATFYNLNLFYPNAGYNERTVNIIWWGQALLWVCNWPHFAATSYRLYHSTANIKQYPLTALAIPWLIAAAAVGSILYPTTIAPYFILIYIFWSPYHFSGQTVGVTMIYARRANFFVGKLERFALASFIYGSFISQTILSQTVREEGNPLPYEYFGIKYPSMGMHVGWYMAAEVWMYLSGLLFVALVVRWCIQSRRLLPPIVVLPALAQYVWFVMAPQFGIRSFLEYVPFFHSMQYLLIAWSMQLKEKLDREQARTESAPASVNFIRVAIMLLFGAGFFATTRLISEHDPQAPDNIVPLLPWLLAGVYTCYIIFSIVMQRTKVRSSYSYVVFETLRWLDLNIVIGACLFFLSPLLLSHFFNVDKILTTGVIVTAVQIHHFFVDGVIWKLKRTTVSSPLMVNISDMLTPGPQPAPVISASPAPVLVASGVEQKA